MATKAEKKADEEYALHTLIHATRLANEGNYESTLKLGLTEENINKIVTLNYQELHDLAGLLKGNFVKIQFHSTELDLALKIIEDKSQRHQQIKEMMKAGASQPVMSHFYGLTHEDLANFKRMLHIPVSEGRPTMLSEDNETKLWNIVKSAGDIDSEILPNLLLIAFKEIGAPISSMWPLLNKWWEENKSLSRSPYS